MDGSRSGGASTFWSDVGSRQVAEAGGGGVTPDQLEDVQAAIFAVGPSLRSGATAGALGGLTGTLLGDALVGATAATAGNVAGQAFELATGQESQFNWDQLGESAIGGAIGGVLPDVPGLSDLEDEADAELNGNGSWLGAAVYPEGATVLDLGVNGLIGNALTQGVGAATGLQTGFSVAGVATAGAEAAAFAGVGVALSGGALDPLVKSALQGTAAVIVGASARSLVTGQDFGTSLTDELPNVIGQTEGNLVADGIQQASQPTPTDVANAAFMKAYNAGDLSDGSPAMQFNGDGTSTPILDANGNPVLIDENVPGSDIAPTGSGAGTTPTQFNGAPISAQSGYQPAAYLRFKSAAEITNAIQYSGQITPDVYSSMQNLGLKFSDVAAPGIYQVTFVPEIANMIPVGDNYHAEYIYVSQDGSTQLMSAGPVGSTLSVFTGNFDGDGEHSLGSVVGDRGETMNISNVSLPSGMSAGAVWSQMWQFDNAVVNDPSNPINYNATQENSNSVFMTTARVIGLGVNQGVNYGISMPGSNLDLVGVHNHTIPMKPVFTGISNSRNGST